jgi:hypothetical protein
MNPLNPDHMTADDRIAEICKILSSGLIRLQARKSSSLSADPRDSSVDFAAVRSRHADASTRR